MITSLIDADLQEYHRDCQQQFDDMEFTMRHPYISNLLLNWYWVLNLWPRAVCRIRGHDLVDNGYATPDSGCIQMDCQRCGYSYPTHWLY